MDIFKIKELTPEEQKNVFKIFTNSYMKAKGASWDESKFFSRANNWTFYGDKDKGFVAIREQNSGLIKIVGVAGQLSSISAGIDTLKNSGKPIWGMADKKLVDVLVKRGGFICPPGFIIKLLSKFIPKSVFDDVDYELNSDGSFTFKYTDVGDATKFFFCNKKYFLEIYPMLKENMGELPFMARQSVELFLKGLNVFNEQKQLNEEINTIKNTMKMLGENVNSEHMINLHKNLIHLNIGSDSKIHITQDEIKGKNNYRQPIQDFKPKGLWYGLGFSWLEFVKNQAPEIYGSNKDFYVYEFNTSKCNILKLSNIDDIIKFTKLYGTGKEIDWFEVSKKYDGIEFNPYINQGRKFVWYYTVDVASGCIWNGNKIEYKLIYPTNELNENKIDEIDTPMPANFDVNYIKTFNKRGLYCNQTLQKLW